MKKYNYLLITLLAFSLYSCDNENITEAITEDPIQNEYLQIIKQLGFDETSAIDKGDYYLVEGGIMLSKKDLPEYAGTTGQKNTLNKVFIYGPETFCTTATYSVNIPSDYSVSWSWSKWIEPVGSTTGTQIVFKKVENSAAWIKATVRDPQGNTTVAERSIIYAGAPDFSDDKTTIQVFQVNRKDMNIEYEILETIWTIRKNGYQRSYNSNKNWMSPTVVLNDGFISEDGYYNVGVRGRNRCGWGYETTKLLYISRY